MSESADSRIEPKGGSVVADRYRIDRLLARGGMAAVYLAQHVKLNRPVALKVLSPPPDAEDPESFEERFKLEAETLSALDHPNIVIVHDFGEMADGRFFIAMEYVEGPRLTDLVKDAPLDPHHAVSLIIQVCAALRYAHKRGVVHRDLKPSNILVKQKDGGENVKVVDFGLVKLTSDDQNITRAGLILGSPHCMAPEQIRGVDIDARCDIYATGILLFRLITGAYPFHGANSAATMIEHMNAPVPTFFSVKPDLVAPPGLEEIVRKCLEKRAEDRYPDMQSLMNDLATAMNLPPEQYKTTSTATNVTMERRQKPQYARTTNTTTIALIGLLALGLLMMLAVIGVAAFSFGSSFRPTPPAVEPLVQATPPVAPVVHEPPALVVEDAPPTVVVAPVVPPPVAPPPAVKRAPRAVAPKVEPPPAVVKPETKEPTPTGYMGLPEDL